MPERTEWLCTECGWTGDCMELERSDDSVEPACPECGCSDKQLKPPENWDEQVEKILGVRDGLREA